MNNKRQRLFDALEGLTIDELLCFLAIAHAYTGQHPGNVGTHSKGVFKRSIKNIRKIQSDFPNYESLFNTAVAFIRAEWLHKED